MRRQKDPRHRWRAARAPRCGGLLPHAISIAGVEELCVTTNGSLLKEVARPLRDAGVTPLNISLDTLNEERFRAITRLGTLQDTLDGIEAAERAGVAKI